MKELERPKRPLSVWVAQILLVLLSLLCLLMQLFILMTYGVDAPRMLIAFLLSLAFLVAFPFTAFIGMAKRKNWGRWMGVGFLAFLFIMSIVGQLYPSQGPIKQYEYENDVQRTSGTITQIVMYGLLLLLIFRLSFGDRVSQFFSYDASGDETVSDSLVE